MIVNKNSLSLEDVVFEQLEKEILSGELLPGEQLKELALSTRLRVSRTPIRGAFRRLADAGLIEITANKGATVVGVTESDISNAYTIRTRLDGLASKLAAQKISAEDLRQLEDAVELAEFYVNKKDFEKLRELDTDFHRIIYRACGNRILCKILTDLHRSIKVYRSISLSKLGEMDTSFSEHREILEAIKRGDGDEADRLTSIHVKNAMNKLLSQFGLKK